MYVADIQLLVSSDLDEGDDTVPMGYRFWRLHP